MLNPISSQMAQRSGSRGGKWYVLSTYGLACCNSWGREESDMTERLIWSEAPMYYVLVIFNVLFLLTLPPWEIQDSHLFFFFFFWPWPHSMQGLLVPWPEIKPKPGSPGSPHLNLLKKVKCFVFTQLAWDRIVSFFLAFLLHQGKVISFHFHIKFHIKN